MTPPPPNAKGDHVPLEGQRIVRIILEECSSLPEHYPGYRKDLLDLVTDILALERQRAWQNIAHPEENARCLRRSSRALSSQEQALTLRLGRLPMKLVAADFHNFRLLRHLRLEFATDR